MSSDIEIKEGEFSDLSIEVKASSISIWIEGISIGEWADGKALVGATFDLKDNDDRQAIKNLIWHLQHQLNLNENCYFDLVPDQLETHKENEE